MAYEVRIDAKALKALHKLPESQQIPIWNALEGLENNPRPSGAIPLQGIPSLLRLRVGEYRILYTILNKQLLILVVKIGHRREVYRRIEDLLRLLKRIR